MTTRTARSADDETGTESAASEVIPAETDAAETGVAETGTEETAAVAADTAVSGEVKRAAAKRPVRRGSWRDRRIALDRRRLIVAGAVAVIVIGMGSTCGYFAYEHGNTADQVAAARAQAADRDAASKAGADFLTTMFTVNDSSLDHWDSAVLAATTDSMHDQLGQWRQVLDKLVKAHTDMTSSVKDIGVVSQNDDAITLLAVIESTGSTDPANPQPGTTDSSALVDMRKIGAQWKVSGYGPAGGVPPAAAPAAPPAADTPAPTTGDQAPR
ncbi:hypothetical protein ACIP5Y_01475 [Nocardia sp. NPDC088792]|uniref:hypothetical protein n=1 Tax=Nocardia sp. NPDC088792 TaxID=3364332 RepID=UPI00381D284A